MQGSTLPNCSATVSVGSEKVASLFSGVVGMSRRANSAVVMLRIMVIVILGGSLLVGVAAADEPATVDVETLEGDGTEANQYIITNVSELQTMEQDLGAHYVLGNDINASETANWNGGLGFEPIGNETHPFTGTLDGGGRVIDGLSIDRTQTSDRKDAALFAYVTGGTIKNIDLINAEITGDSGANRGTSGWGDGGNGGDGGNAGALIAVNNAGTVENAAVLDSTVTGGAGGNGGDGYDSSTSSGRGDGGNGGNGGAAGGLIAVNSGGSVKNSSVSDSEVTGGAGGAGGEGSFSGAQGEGGDGGNGGDAGGLIASNPGGTVNDSYVSRSDINGGTGADGADGIWEVPGNGGAGGDAGGLIGENSAGSVSGSFVSDSVLSAGERGSGGWSSGLGVSGTTGDAGAVGGSVASNDGTVTDTYWDRSNNPTLEDTGSGDIDGATSLTSQQMSGLAAVVYMHKLDFSATWLPGATIDSHPDHALNSNFVDTEDAFDTFVEGDGAADPYEITVVHELQLMYLNRSANYTLKHDLDATVTSEWFTKNGVSRGFKPIGECTLDQSVDCENEGFTGAFDGAGHTIKGLYINRSDSDEVGLFGWVGGEGTVTNVGIKNADISGNDSVGGLIGSNFGAVSKSYATGRLSGNDRVGGVVGSNFGGTDLESGGTVRTSYATISVLGGSEVGGLVGKNTGAVIDSYATGRVDGSGSVGGLVGENAGDLTDSYWDKGTTNQSTAIGDQTAPSLSVSYTGFGETTDTGPAIEMIGLNATVYMESFDFDDEWRVGDDSHPDLAWNSYFTDVVDAYDTLVEGDGDAASPYEVTTIVELQRVDHNLSAQYTVGNDIDASATEGWNGDAGFEPIGRGGNPFEGTFDGNGHNISRIHIDRADASYVGLFGSVEQGKIQNVGLADANVTGGNFVGGLVGFNDGNVSASYVSGEVTGGWHVGGVSGRNSGLVSRSYATGNVTGDFDVGGLVGRNFGDGRISGSYAAGPVVGTVDVGGLVGVDTGLEVTDSHWDVETTGQSSSAGSVTEDGLTTSQMRGYNATIFTALDFAAVFVPVEFSHPELDTNRRTSLAVVTIDTDESAVATTSPHVANGTDAATVTVTVVDSTGSPVSGLGADRFDVDFSGGAEAGEMTESVVSGVYEFPVTHTEDEAVTVTVTIDEAPIEGSPEISFEHNSYTIAFNSRGGDLVADITQELGTTITAPNVNRAGYSFTEWTAEADGNGRSYVPGEPVTMPAGGMTLYAQWASSPRSPPSRPSNDQIEDEVRITLRNESANTGLTVNVSRATAGETVRIDNMTTGIDQPLGQLKNVAVDGLSIEMATDLDFWLEITTFERDRDHGSDANEIEDGAAAHDVADAIRMFENETGTVSAGSIVVDHNLEPGDTSNVTFAFSVRQSYLSELGVTPEEVTLYRHEADGWTAHPTTYVDDTETHHSFEAVSPGFSVFTIGTGVSPFEVSSAELEQTTISKGETATISATVENRGTNSGNYTVALLADGESVDTETVTLDRNESTTVALSFTPSSAGEYNLSIGDQMLERLTVSQANDQAIPNDDEAMTATDATEIDSDDEDGGIGTIWHMATVLVVGSLLLALLRKRRVTN